MGPKVVTMVLTLALIMAVMNVGGASADGCDVGQLAECLPAIVGGSAPTGVCCTNLSAQQPCFCQYAKDPNYGKYVNSPNASKVLTTCGIAIPSC